MSTSETPITTYCDVPSLWQAHKDALRSFILKRVKDQDLADDILQETLLKVYKHCTEKTGVKNIRSWLFQIAYNNIMDHYRNQTKYSNNETFPELIAEETNEAYQDALNYILPMLAFLPEDYSTPLKMADIDGLKQADIAKKLGLTLTAVKSRIQRGRNLLKAEFMTCCHFETDKKGNIIAFSIKESCAPLQKHKKDLLQ